MEEPVRKLPVTRILLSAVVAPIIHRRRILWFAIPLVVIDVGAVWFGQSALASGASSAPTILGNIGLAIAAYVAALLLTVACHRIFILGEGAMARQRPLRWTSRETQFLGWSVGLGLLGACLFLPAMLVLAPVGAASATGAPWEFRCAAYVLSLPAVYVITRLSLVLPATATDMEPDFSWAFQASKGNGIRLMIAISFLPVLCRVLLVLAPKFESVVYNSGLSLVGVYAIVSEVAALSTSYRVLASDHPVPAVRDARV